MKRTLMCFYFLAFISNSFAQNVGIGTATPARARLEVNGVAGTGTTSAIFGGDGMGISFQRSPAAVGFNQYRDNISGNGKYIGNGVGALQSLDPANGSMYLDIFPYGTANTLTPGGIRAFTISNAGNVGIRTSPTSASLITTKAGNYNGAATLAGTFYRSYFCYGDNEVTYIRGGLSASRVIINDLGGGVVLGGGNSFVGINTASPLATLDIHQAAGKGIMLIDPVGSFQNWFQKVGYYNDPPESDLKFYYNEMFVSYFSAVHGYYDYLTSDSRIKSNIHTMPSVVSKLATLQPKIYEMKDFNPKHEKTFGFIAQDIKQLYPEFVRVQHIEVDSVNHFADLHALDYSGFDIIAIKALQEQYDQIKFLEEENAALLRRLESLEDKLLAKKAISVNQSRNTE